MPDQALEVVGAIIERDGKVLACRRSPERSAGGLWEFPGGKVEGDESPESALRREIKEELGVDITVGALASRHTTPLGSRLIDLACYWATLEGEAPTSSSDHDRMEWVDLHDLDDREWSPADVPIIDELVASTESN